MRKIRFCYDVVCPYSYMESHLIETARTQVRSMSNAFRSSCGRPRRRCSRSGRPLRVDWTRHVHRLELERRIEIHRPRYQPRSTLPLATCLWAGDQGRLREFKHPLYEAFFCEGEDTSRTARSRVPPTEPGSIGPLPSPRRTRPGRCARTREIRLEAEATGVRGVRSLVAEDGATHWGMGGLERFARRRPLVPRTG